MPHYKRRRCRRQVRCTLCTDVRWRGNSKGRFRPKNEGRHLKADEEEQREGER